MKTIISLTIGHSPFTILYPLSVHGKRKTENAGKMEKGKLLSAASEGGAQ